MVVVRFQICTIKHRQITNIYNDAYTKTETDLTLSGYTNSIDLHNDFYNEAKMSIISYTYYTITEIQANYYDNVATGPLFPNIDVSNYYSNLEVDDIGDGLSTLLLNTYTKTEIDTQLTVTHQIHIYKTIT